MVELVDVEFERILNLVRNFGWEEIERKREGLVLEIRLRKTIPEELAEVAGAPPAETVMPT